jgi:hypothetical protein
MNPLVSSYLAISIKFPFADALENKPLGLIRRCGRRRECGILLIAYSWSITDIMDNEPIVDQSIVQEIVESSQQSMSQDLGKYTVRLVDCTD